MSSFILHNKNPLDTTPVSNRFLDEFMPSANGSFVKVYLFLLRHADSPEQMKCSISHMADLFENTEADILRAIRYWERTGLIQVQANADGSIESLFLLPLPDQSPQPRKYKPEEALTETAACLAPPLSQAVFGEAKEPFQAVPPMPEYDPAELSVLSEDSEIKAALNIIETMMGSPVTEQYLRLIVYIMSELGFSLELTSFVFETALSKGKKAPRYMEKVAVDWATKRITTVSEAEAEASHYNTIYNLIRSHMGMERLLTPVERSIVDGWEKFHFSETILAEACKRTILNTGKPGFNYADKILERWHKAGVKNLSDVQKMDKNYKTSPLRKQPSGNRFQNFPQRNYSEKQFQALEQQLLNK